jgi:Ser/Thr protein kinase RdoA (MazF antagonist)
MMLRAAYSTIDAGSIAEAIDAHYAIGPARGCVLFMRGFNDVYAFEGSAGRRYVARLCDNRFRGPPNIDYETALLQHLLRSGISVGTPVEDREGRLWRNLEAPEGPRAFAVFERLAGRAPFATLRRTGKADAQTLSDIGLLGASFARIHLAGDSYVGPASLYRLEGEHLLANPLAQILSAPGVGEALAADFADFADDLAGRLAERASGLSVGVCHGDNHGGNTLIADGEAGAEVAGWFDFDDAGPGFLAYDLAVFLWQLLVQVRAADIGDARRPLWPAFVAGYRKVRPISEADFEAVGLFVAIRHVNLMGQYASRIPQWGSGFVSDDWFRSELQLARKWEGLVTPAA